jgi:hypothetical protein
LHAQGQVLAEHPCLVRGGNEGVKTPVALGVADDALDHDVVGVAAKLLVAEMRADLRFTWETTSAHEVSQHVDLDLRLSVPTGDRRVAVLSRASPEKTAKGVGW